jgi:hypothetical protein
MAIRNVSKDNTFEQQRVTINQVATDLGDLTSLSTGNKSSLVSSINEVASVSGQVNLSSDIASSSDLSIPFLPSTTSPNTLRYNTGLTYKPDTFTLKSKNFKVNDSTGSVSVPAGSAAAPSLYFEVANKNKVGFYRVNDQVGVGFEGRPASIFFNPDGTITSAGVQTTNASELQLTNNPKCLYVSEQEYYASDSWTNTGLSLNKPFKTITRALLEASRQSYVIDDTTNANNDKFEYFTIIIFPGNYEIDNRPGISLSTESAIDYFENRNNYGPTGKVGSVVPANLITTKTSTFPYNQNFIVLNNSTGLTPGLRVVGPGIPNGAFISSSYTTGNTVYLVNSSGSPIQTNADQTAVTIEFYQSTALRAAALYNNVASTGGSGSGTATFDVKFTGTGVDGDVVVTPNQLGTGYYANERLTISGSLIGGGDLTILITSLFDDSELALQSNIYKLNPPSGGVIVPRGTSLVGLDLRKTVIRPKYIPDPTIPPSGDQRAQDGSNLIKANRDYIISEAFGYLQANVTKKTVSTITQGLILYDNTGTVNDIYEPDIFTCTGHGFVENTPIKFSNIPVSGVTLYANQVYYVDYIDANSFRIKASKNTAPLSTVVTTTQSSLGTLSAYSFNTGSESCKRDIGYYVDALVYDISRGRNSKVFDNAEFYISGTSTQLIKGSTEIFDTLACLKYATNLAAAAVRNQEFKLRATRNATTTLTLSAAQYGLTVGMNVSGTGITAGTTISSITYAANGSATAVTLSVAASGSAADDYTFSARGVYNYGFVIPYYESKFDSYPFFDNIYKTSGTAYTPECNSVVSALFTLYNVFSTIINNPTTYLVSSSANYVQKSYPYGYDRDLETAIFRVTGGCYFWQMTFKDGSQTASSLPWYVNAAGNLTQYVGLQNEPNDSQKEAYRILNENKNVIINTTYNSLLTLYPSPGFLYGAPSGSSDAVINTYKTKCKRDIGYIFDAVATDIFDGGTANTFDSILYYLTATQDALSTGGLYGETTQSIYAFQQLRNNMQFYVQDSKDVNGVNIDTKIATLIGYLTDSLTNPGSVSTSLRNENNNTGQFPCSHHQLVTFKFASKQELSEYYDKVEALYNANFDPDIPATSTAKITSITNDATGDIFTTELNHNYSENTPVKFRPFTVSGVTANRYKTYYIKYVAKNQFKLKNSSSVIPYVSNQAADAYNLVLKNLDVIANEAYYQYNYSSVITLPSNSSATDCLDDVKDVLKAIMYNTKYGYNDKAYEAGYIYATGRYVTNNKTQTIGVLQKARDYAISAMRNLVFFETRNYQSISRTGTTVTVITATAHGLSNLNTDQVVINAANTAYNNSGNPVTATYVNATTFTYTTGATGALTNSAGSYKRADSALSVDSSVTNDPNTPKCASVADAITTLMAIVTTAISNETMDHVIKTVPPITPTEDTEEILTNIVSSNQTGLAVYIYDVNAYSQRTEENRIVGDSSKNTTIDTVSSASPYIFNCSLRSVYGMSGLHANGEDTTGFKSMVLAQYTGISLQRDNRAFTRLNYLNALPTNKVNAADDRFTKVDSEYIDYWRNYHVKASNNGFLQVVSVFAVGYADHFISDTGSDISITNSNSNFGNIATLSAGYKEKAFPQDTRGQIVGIIPPKGIDYSKTNAIIINEIDYRTITKWNESRASGGENRFGKIYIKSTSVDGLYAKDGLPEYTDASGKKWLLLDGVNYLLGRGKNIAYKSNGDYETNSTENEYLYGSFPSYIGSGVQAEFRSRLRSRNPNNALDGQTSYDVQVGLQKNGIAYSTTNSSITILDATSVAAGQKIGSSLNGLTGAYVGNSYVSGNLTIPMTTSDGVTPFFPSVNQTNATIKFYRVLSTPENSVRQYYGWEWSKTEGNIDYGSLVIYIDEFVFYNDVFYLDAYKTAVQNAAAPLGQTAQFPSNTSQSTTLANPDPSGNVFGGISLEYNTAYNYNYGNLLKRILQRYDSDVNYQLGTTDSLEFAQGSTIANAYIKRTTDSRLTKDHIWKFIYKIPKESNAKPPERKYVIQLLSNDAPSYNKSYYIYDVETVDEYIADTQDGIYYLTVLDANVNTIKNSADLLKIGYGQNQYFLYPEVNLDNPEWNPKEAISVFNNDVKIRTVVLEDANLVTDNYERVTSYSISGELTKNFVNYITDKNSRQATFPAGALTSNATNSVFNNIKQVYTSNIDNNIGVALDVFSGSSLSSRVVKFKRTCSAAPSGLYLLNVTDIEKLVVGAELISIAPTGGGTLSGGVSYTITGINVETRTVTLSASLGITSATNYTYTFNNPIAIKIHRPSNIRASGHTWEYVGYGPGNYSTAFPVFQTIVLNRQQIINSQTIEKNGGFNGSSGTNSNGDFFIGTQVIDTKGSQSETVNVPKLKTSAQNRLVDPEDLLFITAASSSGTGNLSAFSDNLQNTVRTQLSDQSSKTVTYDKITVANLEVGTNVKITGSIDIKNGYMNNSDTTLQFPISSRKKYGFAKRVDDTISWSAARESTDEGFVTAKDLGDWAYTNKVTGSSAPVPWSTKQDGNVLSAAKQDGAVTFYNFEYGINFYYNVTAAQLNTTNFYLKMGKTTTAVLTKNIGSSGFIYVNVSAITSSYPVIKGLDTDDINGGVEWKALKNAWLNPSTSENGVSGNFVITYYIHAADKIIYNVNPFEV